MSESASPMLWGTIIFEGQVPREKVEYVGLKIKTLGESDKWSIHVCTAEGEGKHTITLKHSLGPHYDVQKLRASVILLLRDIMRAHQPFTLQDRGVIDWIISNKVTEL